MKFEDIIFLLMQGESVRREEWGYQEHFTLMSCDHDHDYANCRFSLYKQDIKSDDWVIFSDLKISIIKKNLQFKDAIKYLDEGYIVKREKWSSTTYMQGRYFIEEFSKYSNFLNFLSMDDILAEDWMLKAKVGKLEEEFKLINATKGKQ